MWLAILAGEALKRCAWQIRLPGRGVSRITGARARLPVLGNGYLRGSYEGDCEEKNELAHGQGEVKRRRRHVGCVREGQARRQGRYTWENGARLEGTFKAGKADGPGVYVSREGAALRRSVRQRQAQRREAGRTVPQRRGHSTAELQHPASVGACGHNDDRDAAPCRGLHAWRVADVDWPGCSRSSVATARRPSPALAGAQDGYPSKPITLIVPFPPGGVADIVGRPFADALSRELKTPVDHREQSRAPAAASAWASSQRRSRTATRCCWRYRRSRSCPEADKVTRPRAPLPARPVRADRAAHRRSDGARRTRGQSMEERCRISSRTRASGPVRSRTDRRATTERCTCRWRCSRKVRHAKLLHVPFTGGGPAVVALLGGQVDALATGPSTVLQHVKAGKVRVLASWGDQRLASLPDVRTLSESGFNAVFFQWSALFAPAGAPDRDR